MSQIWFSAMLRFVVLIEDEGSARLSRSVIVFRAQDFLEARSRALSLGRGMERSFTGGEGKQVRWRLHSVETTDMIGDIITDPLEIYSEPAALSANESYDFEHEFDPNASDPTSSGV